MHEECACCKTGTCQNEKKVIELENLPLSYPQSSSKHSSYNSNSVRQAYHDIERQTGAVKQ